MLIRDLLIAWVSGSALCQMAEFGRPRAFRAHHLNIGSKSREIADRLG